jgi:hypothetical protein
LDDLDDRRPKPARGANQALRLLGRKNPAAWPNMDSAFLNPKRGIP